MKCVEPLQSVTSQICQRLTQFLQQFFKQDFKFFKQDCFQKFHSFVINKPEQPCQLCLLCVVSTCQMLQAMKRWKAFFIFSRVANTFCLFFLLSLKKNCRWKKTGNILSELKSSGTLNWLSLSHSSTDLNYFRALFTEKEFFSKIFSFLVVCSLHDSHICDIRSLALPRGEAQRSTWRWEIEIYF